MTEIVKSFFIETEKISGFYHNSKNFPPFKKNGNLNIFL